MNNQNVFLANRKKLGLKWATALLLLLTLLPISIVHATPILLWDSDYQLTGANGVLIDGWSYNVRFIDSSCNLIWSGCDRNKFLFKSEAYARKASQALLDQVLLDVAPHLLFDTVPYATAGIEEGGSYGYGEILTPWNIDSTTMYLVSAFNSSTEYWDRTLNLSRIGWSDDSLAEAYTMVYARWSVPEPASVTLVAVGLMGVAFLRRKHKHS